jgi:hypothetical protein
VVWGDQLTLDLCEELERLAPFGLGNPGPLLLAPACTLSELGVVGDGRHLKLAVTADGVRSGAIAFGQGAQLDRLRTADRWDVAFRLQANRWNGSVSPQLVVRRFFETSARYLELRGRLAAEWRGGEAAWGGDARAVFHELELTGEAPGRRHLLESEAFRSWLGGEEATLEEAA